MADQFPGLTQGVLHKAELVDLPDGLLLRVGSDLAVSLEDFGAERERSWSPLAMDGSGGDLYFLEDLVEATLLDLWCRAEGEDVPAADLMQRVARKVAARVEARPIGEEALREAFESLAELLGGATFEEARPTLLAYLGELREQEVWQETLRDLGDHLAIEVDRRWVEQVQAEMDHHPDASLSTHGQPMLINFEASGCTACGFMLPVLQALEEEFGAEAEFLALSMNRVPVLARRMGIAATPTQVMVDAEGKEVARHVGILPYGRAKAWIEGQIGLAAAEGENGPEIMGRN